MFNEFTFCFNLAKNLNMNFCVTILCLSVLALCPCRISSTNSRAIIRKDEADQLAAAIELRKRLVTWVIGQKESDDPAEHSDGTSSTMSWGVDPFQAASSSQQIPTVPSMRHEINENRTRDLNTRKKGSSIEDGGTRARHHEEHVPKRHAHKNEQNDSNKAKTASIKKPDQGHRERKSQKEPTQEQVPRKSISREEQNQRSRKSISREELIQEWRPRKSTSREEQTQRPRKSTSREETVQEWRPRKSISREESNQRPRKSISREEPVQEWRPKKSISQEEAAHERQRKSTAKETITYEKPKKSTHKSKNKSASNDEEGSRELGRKTTSKEKVTREHRSKTSSSKGKPTQELVPRKSSSRAMPSSRELAPRRSSSGEMSSRELALRRSSFGEMPSRELVTSRRSSSGRVKSRELQLLDKSITEELATRGPQMAPVVQKRAEKSVEDLHNLHNEMHAVAQRILDRKSSMRQQAFALRMASDLSQMDPDNHGLLRARSMSMPTVRRQQIVSYANLAPNQQQEQQQQQQQQYYQAMMAADNDERKIRPKLGNKFSRIVRRLTPNLNNWRKSAKNMLLDQKPRPTGRFLINDEYIDWNEYNNHDEYGHDDDYAAHGGGGRGEDDEPTMSSEPRRHQVLLPMARFLPHAEGDGTSSGAAAGAGGIGIRRAVPVGGGIAGGAAIRPSRGNTNAENGSENDDEHWVQMMYHQSMPEWHYYGSPPVAYDDGTQPGFEGEDSSSPTPGTPLQLEWSQNPFGTDQYPSSRIG